MILHQAEKELLLPDFLIVGAMRCGTTSLFQYLQSHPSIFMPALKEPQFFSYLGEDFSPHPAHIRKNPWTLKDYCALFENANREQCLGEASTSYLYRFPETIGNIQAIYGEKAKKVKILGILRNPVERAWSIYLLKKQGGTWKGDFFSILKEFENTGSRFHYWNFIDSGKYAEQVRAFQDFFPEIKFFLFEELKRDPKYVVKTCFQFLGVSPPSIPSNVGRAYNFSGIPRSKFFYPLYRILFHTNPLKNSLKPVVPQTVRSILKFYIGRVISTRQPIPEEVRARLRPIFSEDIQKLSLLMSDDGQKEILKQWLG